MLRRVVLQSCLFALLLAASGAHAASITIAFEGTVTGATLALGSALSGGETITGTIVLDDTVAGAFTPSPNVDFVRSEMLYTGAVVSMQVQLLGDTASGTGGDVELFDSAGLFSGEDSYEVTGGLGTGTIAGVAVVGFLWNPAYQTGGFSLTAGDPLFAPPALDPLSVNQFTLTGAPSGGIAFGTIDSFQLLSVPEPSPAALGLVLLGLAALRLLRR
jgi:hypothetical protein